MDAAAAEKDDIAQLLRAINDDLKGGRLGDEDEPADDEDDEPVEPARTIPFGKIAVALFAAAGVGLGVILLDSYGRDGTPVAPSPAVVAETAAPAPDAPPAPAASRLAAVGTTVIPARGGASSDEPPPLLLRPAPTEPPPDEAPAAAEVPPPPAGAGTVPAMPAAHGPAQAQTPAQAPAQAQVPAQVPPAAPAHTAPPPAAAVQAPTEPPLEELAADEELAGDEEMEAEGGAPAAAPSSTGELQAALSVAPAPPPAAAAAAAPAPRRSAPPASASGRFVVQVGTFQEARNADTLVRRLADRGYRAFAMDWVDGSERAWTAVRVGGYQSRGDAARTADALKRELGLSPIVLGTR